MLRFRLIHVSKSGDTCVICSDCLRAIEERLSEAHLIRGCRSVGWQLGLLGVSQILSGFTFSSLWPGDAMWRHRWQNWTNMGLCYIHQCWLIIKQDLWYSPRINSQKMLKISLRMMSLQNTPAVKLLQHRSGANGFLNIRTAYTHNTPVKARC